MLPEFDEGKRDPDNHAHGSVFQAQYLQSYASIPLIQYYCAAITSRRFVRDIYRRAYRVLVADCSYRLYTRAP